MPAVLLTNAAANEESSWSNDEFVIEGRTDSEHSDDAFRSLFLPATVGVSAIVALLAGLMYSLYTHGSRRQKVITHAGLQRFRGAAKATSRSCDQTPLGEEGTLDSHGSRHAQERPRAPARADSPETKNMVTSEGASSKLVPSNTSELD